MAVTKVLGKHYEGLSIDAKPVGAIAGSTFHETDTGADYATYDGTTWIVADKRGRITNEGGTFVDIPAEFAAIVTAIEDI